MAFSHRKHLYLLLALPLIFFLAACEPIQDDTLSPPIIGKPLHSCSETIAFSGADRDSKIRVYVNGSKVHEFKAWMGWGPAKLPVKLNLGDKVTLRQIVGNRISSHSREAVVVSAPPRDPTGERLHRPKIKEPIIECQKMVIVKDTVHGATTKLHKNGAFLKEGMSPYSHIRIGVPELKLGDIYEAKQFLCTKGANLESELSGKAKVRPKPRGLPKPKIHEPLVDGSDSCRVDDLYPGARVEIHAKDASGDVVVGGGTAPSEAAIFHVKPVLDLKKKYYAVQYLCTLGSPPSDPKKPKKHPSAPRVQKPICKDTFYVTVCDTVVMSTVKVFINGTQVAQAAGNGGCVRMALGNATKFKAGQKVTATQIVAGKTSSFSTTVIVKADGTPPYDPAKWNHRSWVRCNNCYNYGCDIRTDTFAQMGKASNHSITPTKHFLGKSAEADGLTKTNLEKKCRECSHLVALFLDPKDFSVPNDRWDYHFYRLDDNGRWSHKPGYYPATDKDASGNPIYNPRTADRRTVGQDYTFHYTIFCGYYCVDKSIVKIKGTRRCR